MVHRSNHRRTLVDALNGLIPQSQAATSAVDEAAAQRLGINRTDLRCLGAVLEEGPVSASKLAETVGLTRGAMTIALDRLQVAGYVRRHPDPSDRRGIRVEATSAAAKAVREIWEPLRQAGSRLLSGYSDAELDVLCRFFGAYCELQVTHAARIRRLESRRAAGAAARGARGARPRRSGGLRRS